jgi:DNA-binding CsgD family transcriptional regulator
MSTADFDLLATLLGCDTPEQFGATVSQQVSRLGFGTWIYALDVTKASGEAGQALLGNYSDAWVEHYFQESYQRVDPVIQHCRAHTTPFPWPQTRHLPGTPRETTRLFDEAAEFGLVSGFSVPIHGVGCTWGLLSMAAPHLLVASDMHALAANAVLLSSYVHEAGHRFCEIQVPLPQVALTDREVECLQWGAEGKSSWEIGRVLGISERTVVFHMQNAAHKLGVSGRQPAIARAVALGLIKP